MAENFLKSMLNRADTTQTGSYHFDDTEGRQDPRVVKIPVSLDAKAETLRKLQLYLVEMEAESARLENEIEDAKKQIRTHQIEFSKEMLLLQIPAPMAKELPPTLPEIDKT